MISATRWIEFCVQRGVQLRDEGKCWRDEGNSRIARDVRAAGRGRKLRGKGGSRNEEFSGEGGKRAYRGIGGISLMGKLQGSATGNGREAARERITTVGKLSKVR